MSVFSEKCPSGEYENVQMSIGERFGQSDFAFESSEPESSNQRNPGLVNNHLPLHSAVVINPQQAQPA